MFLIDAFIKEDEFGVAKVEGIVVREKASGKKLYETDLSLDISKCKMASDSFKYEGHNVIFSLKQIEELTNIREEERVAGFLIRKKDYLLSERASTVSPGGITIRPGEVSGTIFPPAMDIKTTRTDTGEEIKPTFNPKIETLETFLDRNAFIKHIQLLGEKGIGKSRGIELYAKKHKYAFVKIAMSEGKDETDIVGFSIRTADGMAWLDGKVAEAFRLASKGEKVLLLIDEIYRAPKRELSILIDSLTPNSDGFFELGTNRVMNLEDGLATTETIRAHEDNLWVCAASNIGIDYDVDIADLAFQDRWRTKFLDNMTKDEVRKIIQYTTEDKPTQELVMKLWSACNKSYQAKMIAHPMSIRHATELIKSQTKGQDVLSCFIDLAPQLCGRKMDGKLIESDLTTVYEIAEGA